MKKPIENIVFPQKSDSFLQAWCCTRHLCNSDSELRKGGSWRRQWHDKTDGMENSYAISNVIHVFFWRFTRGCTYRSRVLFHAWYTRARASCGVMYMRVEWLRVFMCALFRASGFVFRAWCFTRIAGSSVTVCASRLVFHARCFIFVLSIEKKIHMQLAWFVRDVFISCFVSASVCDTVSSLRRFHLRWLPPPQWLVVSVVICCSMWPCWRFVNDTHLFVSCSVFDA